MPVNLYECMLMLDTGKVGDDLQDFVGQLHKIFEKHHAEIMASRPWIDQHQRLAYPIKKQKKALFYLTYIQVEAKNLLGIEHDIVLNETVIRHLVLKIEPKISETMLAVARDPHGLALQAANADADDYEAMTGRSSR